MSGDREVRLTADAGGILARLVGGAAELAEAALPEWALVGGLAVIAQLATRHRLTLDIDAVVDDDGRLEPAIEVLVTEHGVTRERDRLRLADGTTVDVIAVGAWKQEDLPDDEMERMFVLAHWWAVSTAVTVRLVVVDGQAVVASAVLPVATPAALVATKLQSLRNRRRAPAKAVTDVLDVYRLLVTCDVDGAVAAGLAQAPADLGRWAVTALSETLVEGSGRWARRLGVEDVQPLEVVGSLCADRLRTLLP